MVWPCKQNASGKTPQTSFTCQSKWRRPVGRPRTRWTDYIEDHGWNRLGFYPNETIEVMEDREVWRLNLELLPPQPSRKSGQWRKKKKEDKGCVKRKNTIYKLVLALGSAKQIKCSITNHCEILVYKLVPDYHNYLSCIHASTVCFAGWLSRGLKFNMIKSIKVLFKSVKFLKSKRYRNFTILDTALLF